ncbi:MAG TPA: protein kinase [Pyrinomonadaceae bacterium]|jgi:serine/threonine protein kinase/Tol biopolymer transport system component
MLIGKKIGRYEIRKKIAAGGMGEVYLAHDEQLDRLIALKILSGEFSLDEARRSRFRQEAKAASALNHPNIITIYEIGETDNGTFLATEFIEGETLREYLKRQPLSIARSLKVAEQVANALAAAHVANIIHRDIKPENIMIRQDQIVKILDFGLAKPVLRNVDGSQRSDEFAQTTPGVVVGSVRYMSPEQARGLGVDERTDVWSLGVVLYEMLTGRQPFNGETASDTLAAVIYKEPEPLAQWVPNAPAELQRIVRKALRKEPEERYQNIKDFALDLKNLLYEIEHEISAENKTQPLPAYFIDNSSAPNRIHQTSSANHPTQVSIAPNASSAEYLVGQVKTHKWQSVVASIGIIALLSAISFGFYRWMKVEPLAVKAPAFEKTQISRISTDGKAIMPTISPDGKYIAYLSGDVGSRSLVVRQVATDSIVTIGQPNPYMYRGITFTPDGNYIYYVQLTGDNSLGTLYQVPTLGGTPKKLIEDVDTGVSFSPDGKRMAFIRHVPKDTNDLVFTANSDGSNVQPLAGSKDSDFNFFLKVNPQWSPDGSKILVAGGKVEGGESEGTQLGEIAVADGKFNVFNPKKWKHIVDYVWVKDGSAILLTAKNSEEGATQIWRFGYPNGEIHAVTNDLNNYFRLGLSADSASLITIKNDVVSNLWSFTPQTKELVQISSENRGADGEAGLAEIGGGKLLFTRHDDKTVNLWTIGADDKNAARLTDEAKFNGYPVVSPDGRFVIFSSNRSGGMRIWRMDIDGNSAGALTEEIPNSGDFDPQITPDGKTVIFQRDLKQNGNPALMKVSIEGGTPTQILTDEKVAVMYPRLSPDGKRLAFITFDMTTFKKSLRVTAFDGERVGNTEREFDYNLISSFGWSPDGKSLTYLSVEGIPNLWRLPLDGSKPQPITDFKSGRIFNYAWSRDGKRLFISRGIVNSDLVLIRDAAIVK